MIKKILIALGLSILTTVVIILLATVAHFFAEVVIEWLGFAVFPILILSVVIGTLTLFWYKVRE